MILTKGQKSTLTRLEKKEYSLIKAGDITRLLGKALDRKNTATEIVPKVIDYERFKFPTKSLDKIQKDLSKKIKQKDDRLMFREVLSSGDFTSFDSSTKDKKEQPSVPSITENLPSFGGKSGPTKKSGTSDELNKILDSLIENKPKTNFEGEGRSIVPSTKSESTKSDSSIDLSSIFKTGTKIYKDNIGIVNKVTAGLSDSDIQSGKWLTNLASLELPEIAILQSVTKAVGLGFSKKDNEDFANILSESPDLTRKVSTADSLKLMGKLLINPDEVGNLVATRASQIGANSLQRLKKFYGKITGEKIEDKADFGSLTDLVNSRRDDAEKTEKRTRELNKLKGIDVPSMRTPTKTNIDAGETGMFRGGGVVYDGIGAGQKINQSAEQLLRPPDIPGYKDTTVTQDVFGFLKGLVVPSVRQTKESYLSGLKTSDPENYKKYEEAMQTYNNRKTRIGLTSSSNMDMSIHKMVVQDAFEYYRNALSKASKTVGALTDNEIEDIYDVSSTLEAVMDGKREITYDQFSKINRLLSSEIPPEFLRGGPTKFSDSIKSLGGSLKDGVAQLVSNDVLESVKVASSSSNDSGVEIKSDVDVDAGIDFKTPVFDDDGNLVEEKRGDEKEDPKPEEPEEPVKQQLTPGITEKVLSVGDAGYSTYRPRFLTGNTDKLLGREEEEIKLADKIINDLGIENAGWGSGSSNSLYKANILADRLRYERTISMPRLPIQPNRTISEKFIRRAQPVFQPVMVPALRSFASDGYNPANSYQYTGFHPSVMETPFYGTEIRTHPHENTYQADMYEQEHEATIPNYFQNLRWV